MLYRVLLAEESPIITNVVEEILENEGFQIKSVCSGEEAFNELDAFNPHILLASSDLQGIDGYELCKRIKTIKINTKIPVILLAGAYEPFNQEYACAIGIDDYILKPFESSVLIGKIKKLLNFEGFESYEPPTYQEDLVSISNSQGYISSDKTDIDEVIIIENTVSTPPYIELSELSEEKEFEEKDISTESSELIKHKEPCNFVTPDEVSNLLKKPLEDVFDNYLKTRLSNDLSTICRDEVRRFLYEVAPQMIDEMVKQRMEFILSSMAIEIENEMKKVLPEIIKNIINKKLEKVI